MPRHSGKTDHSLRWSILLWISLALTRSSAQSGTPDLMVVAAEPTPSQANAGDYPGSLEDKLDSPRISKRIGFISERDTNDVLSEETNARTIKRVGPNNPQDLASDIHCLKSLTSSMFTAFLKPPNDLTTQPVLEERTSRTDQDTCLITKTNLDSVFALDLSQLEECGVRSCVVDGEDWLCLLVRFPVMAGLMLPEDEVIDIKCKPQEPSVEGLNVINFQKNTVEQRSPPTIYLGGGHDFLSEIGLFRRLGGTELFASRVKSGSTIELGENVQLRSIVRAGDGWNYAKISDVVIHRVHEGQPLSDERNTARLVTQDGCRNPAYRVLAPLNPWRDSDNRLINNFDFRVFMFQDMESGDAIMISAKVIACVEEIDCAPARCGRDDDAGYGKKRRRRRSVSQGSNHSDTTSLLDQEEGKTQRWEENLELKIRLPHDLIRGDRTQTGLDSVLGVAASTGAISLTESECKLYLILTLSVALTFCVLSAGIVCIACIKRIQQIRSREKRDGKSNSGSARPISDPANPREDESEALKLAYLPYVISYDVRHSMQHTSHTSNLTSLSNGGSNLNACSTPRPVTVRSVKRRDKAKAESRLQLSQTPECNVTSRSKSPNRLLHRNSSPNSGDDEHAVMV